MAYGENTFNLDGREYTVMDDGTVLDENGYVVPDKTAALRQVEANAPGAVQTAKNNSGFDFNSILSNLSNIVTTVVQAEAQRDLLRMNLDRAARGLPPINAQQYMPGVNVGVADDTKNLVYIGLAVFGGVALISALSKRR